MSSTGRGADRSPNDYYRTQSWCVEAIAPHLAGTWRTVVDPGCGDGAIGAGLRAAGWETPIVGVEIDQSLRHAALSTGHYSYALLGDYLTLPGDYLTHTFGGPTWTASGTKTIVVGNPPYSLAMEFVERSMELADTVAMLLRLPWAAGKCRRDFHRANPCDLYVLPRRPSFSGNGRSDSCDYAWFVWSPFSSGRWCVL